MKKSRLKPIEKIKIKAFFSVFIVASVTGLLLFLRPTVSEKEKRNLTEFPTLTWETFWNGEFFSDVETWYADTYPAREWLISANEVLKSTYGIQSETIIGKAEGDDVIPSTSPSDRAELPTASPSPTTQPTTSPTSDPTPTATPTTEPEDENGEKLGGMYVSGKTAYGLYGFNQTNSDWYAAILNKAYDLYGSQCDIYSIIAPVNSGILLSESKQKSIGSANQQDAISYMYSRMDKNIRTVEVSSTLLEHTDEYIYFRTDHHWTARGAYYAYVSWCDEKGIHPHDLSSFQTATFDGFVGTSYSTTGAQVLKDNPDSVEVFYPNATNSMVFRAWNKTTSTVEQYDWRIIDDGDKKSTANKYLSFVGGDQALSWAENPNITDGSSVLVIKDSFGNSFIPYLIDHYQYIYWVDYRSYTYRLEVLPSLSEFITEKGIQDIIFIQQIYGTGSASLLQQLQDRVIS